MPSVNLELKTRLLRLKSLSTGALEGIVILYFKNSCFTFGYFLKQLLTADEYNIYEDTFEKIKCRTKQFNPPVD